MTTDYNPYKDPNHPQFMGVVNISDEMNQFLVNIGDEMTQFLGWKQGEPITKVNTRHCVMEYIKKYKLNDLSYVYPDAILKQLLKCDGKITYEIWIQKIEQHFTPIQN